MAGVMSQRPGVLVAGGASARPATTGGTSVSRASQDLESKPLPRRSTGSAPSKVRASARAADDGSPAGSSDRLPDPPRRQPLRESAAGSQQGPAVAGGVVWWGWTEAASGLARRLPGPVTLHQAQGDRRTWHTLSSLAHFGAARQEQVRRTTLEGAMATDERVPALRCRGLNGTEPARSKDRRDVPLAGGAALRRHASGQR
jgi:hypothetical protein